MKDLFWIVVSVVIACGVAAIAQGYRRFCFEDRRAEAEAKAGAKALDELERS